MAKEELRQEAEEYTKNLLEKLGIKEDMLLENQPKYLRHENMNFVALNVENVTDAYLASAEPREKQLQEKDEKITELEKKINILEGQLSLHEGILWNDLHRLEKENAELKEKLKPENCLKLLAKGGYIKFTSEQLTKAKELLQQWVQTSKASGCDNINIVADTEQFLSEVEK